MHLPETSNEVSGYDADALAFASVSSGRRAVLSHALLSYCCRSIMLSNLGRVEFDRLHVGIQYKAMPMLRSGTARFKLQLGLNLATS